MVDLLQQLNIDSEQAPDQTSQDLQSVSELFTVSRKAKANKDEHLSEADISPTIDEHVTEDVNSTRTELSTEHQLVKSSEDDEPPEHFSLLDAKKQALIEEEQKRQHLAK